MFCRISTGIISKAGGIFDVTKDGVFIFYDCCRRFWIAISITSVKNKMLLASRKSLELLINTAYQPFNLL